MPLGPKEWLEVTAMRAEQGELGLQVYDSSVFLGRGKASGLNASMLGRRGEWEKGQDKRRR